MQKTLYRATGNWPVVQQRQVRVVPVRRDSRRPQASRRGAATESYGATVKQHAADGGTWETSEELPFEQHPEDVGWLPGPVGGDAGRSMPKFKGKRPGPTDTALNARSTSRQIVQSIHATPAFCVKVTEWAKGHCKDWRKHHGMDSIERAVNLDMLKPEHYEVWLAARIRIASLNPAIPAAYLWDRHHHLYDPLLDRAMPYGVCQWLNRHLSFSTYGRQ